MPPLTKERIEQERQALLEVLNETTQYQGLDVADAMWGAAHALISLRKEQGLTKERT